MLIWFIKVNIKNMKEFRVQNKQNVYRIFFAFDPNRIAILLLGGNKRGARGSR